MILSINDSIYIILIFISYFSINAVLTQFSKGSIKFAFWLLGVILLVAFSSLRYGIGTDFFSYREIYESILNLKDDVEPLYILINVFSFNVLKSFYGVVIITSLITHVGISYVLLKESKQFALSSFLYVSLWFFFVSWNLIRQFCALSFIFLFIYSLLKKKYISCLIYSLLAVLMHYTAIIPIALFMIIKNSKYYYLTIFLMLAIFFSFDFFLAFAFPDLKYTHYLFSNGVINFTAFYLNLSILLPCVLIKYRKLKLVPGDNYFLRIYIVGLVFLLLSTKNLYFTRIAYYFLAIELLLLPNILSYFKNSYDKLVVVSFLLIYGILTISVNIRQLNSGVIPLSFVF